MTAQFASNEKRPGDLRIGERITALDWSALAQALDANGAAVMGGLLTVTACRELAGLYDDDARFRSTITMARHGFGRGVYRYFDYPLPDMVQDLRAALYSRLAPIANRWRERLGKTPEFSSEHEGYLERCRRAGQTKPTPLLLRYREGDYNCLHQDLYGEHVFPLQVAVLLAEPGRDFEGGEFVLTEQRPRMQSRVEVAALHQGDGIIFPVRERPVQGSKGVYRVNMRHGVSRVRGGLRHALGIIFHDAA